MGAYNGGMRRPSLRAAGLLLTDACPARCRHCYVAAGPDGRRWMTPDDAAAHLAALARLGVPAGGVHVGGGEPFLRFDRLLQVARAAPGGLGYVETGAAWAEGNVLCRDRLRALAGAGVRQLSLSADPYHQEFIPPDRPQRVAQIAREVFGPGGLRARRWRWLKAPRDVAAWPEADRLALFAAFLRRYPERMTGRAAETLARLVPRVPLEAIPTAPCPAPAEADHVHVDPDGWIAPGTCAGLALGRATAETPLDAALAAWDAAERPFAAALAEGGPRRLAETARARGWAPDPAGYAGPCHLCWSVRGALARAGAGGDELRPAALYARAAARPEPEEVPR